jgi:hypothetical protein
VSVLTGTFDSLPAMKGLPGNVYQLSVFVPDPSTLVSSNPNLTESGVQLVMRSANSSNFANSQIISQKGILISIK